MCMLSLVNHFDSMSVPYIIGFGSEKLVPAFVHSFILSLVELHHCEHHPDFVGPVFNGQGRVGSHTGIYILEESQLHCFSWSHASHCPFSQPLPIFCPKCSVYLPWERPYIHPDCSQITNTCWCCGYYKVTVKGAGLRKWSSGQELSDDSEGDWFVTHSYHLIATSRAAPKYLLHPL